MFTSDLKVISMSDSIDNKKTTKTISLSDLNTTLDNSTKIISLNSPKKSKKNIKSISFLDSEKSDINKSDINNSTLKSDINNFDINNSTLKSELNESILNSDINNSTLKKISFNEIVQSTDTQILDSDTMKSFNFYNNKKEIIYLNTISDILKLKQNSCIRYKHKLKLKTTWAIIHNIIVNNNHIILLLKKGKFSWIHKINLKYYNYFITPH